MYSAALLLTCLPIALAQDVINNIVVPTTARGGDSNTFGGTVDVAGSLVDDSNCTMELMIGESSGAGNNVADIVRTCSQHSERGVN